jgi:V8-like Glu-specific endopeptidase
MLTAAGTSVSGQEPQAAPDPGSRARLLELLRNAPPAPIHPGSRTGAAAESDAPEARQQIGIDLSNGLGFLESRDAMPRTIGAGSSPSHRGEDPTGPGGSGPAPGTRQDGDSQPIEIAAVTPPTPLVNPLNFPFRTVYKLLMRFTSGGNSYHYVCSAASIGAFHLLSAGHCIYNHDPNSDGNTSDAGFAVEVWAWAAQTDQVNPSGVVDHPYGEAKATYLRTYTAWTASQDLNHDMATITLNRRVGDRSGWMGRETNTPVSSLNFSGYPSETPYVPSGTPYQYPGFDSGNVYSYSTYRINMGAYIYGGHSGGPEWRFDSGAGERWIQGVNSTSNRIGSASGTLLTNEKFDDLANNIAADEAARPPTARADLIEYLFSTSAKALLTDTVSPGGTVTVEYNVLNAGHATATNVVLDFRLSTDSNITTSDTALGTLSLGSIAANTYTNSTTTLTIPINQSTRSYYVGWILSTSASEYASDDNTVVIADETLTVTLAPDLVTINPGVSTSTLFTGASFVASATAHNQGTAAASSTTLRYYLSTNSTISTSDTQLATDAVPALSIGATASLSEAVTAPLSPGSYWIGACVDTVSGELTTGNQCSSGVALTVIGRPDLRTMTPLVSKTVLITRETFTVSATIDNLGGSASTSSTLRYYASTDATISTADMQLGSEAVAVLGAGVTAVYSEPVEAPRAPGTYWIGGCVDVVLDESVTSNQCSTGVAVTLTHFTDDSLAAGTTITAIHFQEMRTKANLLRSTRGIAAAVWTDASLTNTLAKAIHLQEIRAALAAVYSYDNAPQPTYTNPSISAGDPIRAIDIIETRAAIVARP